MDSFAFTALFFSVFFAWLFGMVVGKAMGKRELRNWLEEHGCYLCREKLEYEDGHLPHD